MSLSTAIERSSGAAVTSSVAGERREDEPERLVSPIERRQELLVRLSVATRRLHIAIGSGPNAPVGLSIRIESDPVAPARSWVPLECRTNVEQAEADLKAAGFDVAAERAKADAFLDALGSGEGTPRQRRPRAADDKRRRRPRPSVAWLAAAATVGGMAGGGPVAALGQTAIVYQAPLVVTSTSAPLVPSSADLVTAADLRRKASAACDAKQWACASQTSTRRAPPIQATTTRLP